MLVPFTAFCYILAHSSSQASCAFSHHHTKQAGCKASSPSPLPFFCHPEVNDNPKIIKVYVVHALYVICNRKWHHK